jgi:hypothetical protein
MLLLVVNTHETAIHVPCHIPLEAPDDLFLGQPLLGPPVHIVPRSGIEAHPDQDDPPQRVVGDSVPTAVQPVSVRLPEEAGSGATPHSLANAASTPGDDSTAVDTSSSGNDFKISAPGFGVIQHDAGHTYPDGTHHGITAEFPFTPEVEAELCAALTS